MVEEQVKQVIRFKLDATDKMLDLLPAEVAAAAKTLELLIYEGLGEHLENTKSVQDRNAGKAGSMNKVDIE